MLGAEMALRRQVFIDAALRHTDLREFGSDQDRRNQNSLAQHRLKSPRIFLTL